MTAFLWVGCVIGAIIGAAHGIALFRRQAAAPGGSLPRALYYGLWAFALWTLFGAYVLFFYLLGAAGMVIARLIPRRRPT